MRILLILVIGLAIAGVVLYFFMGSQLQMQSNIQQQESSAQGAADAYKKSQQDMMRQLEQ